MSATSFKNALELRLLSLATAATGQTSGLSPYVKLFDDHLYDVDVKTQMPFVVAFALNTEREQVEISTYGNWLWHCQLYYLDTTQDGESWDTGKTRRDTLVEALEESFEGNHFLADSTGPLTNTDGKGVTEYAWQTEITNVTFDQSGMQGYYTFVSELYLDVHTSKS